MNYIVYLHPADAESSLDKIPEQFHPFKVQSMSWLEYGFYKSALAPSATDEEFWPRGTAYIVEGDE